MAQNGCSKGSQRQPLSVQLLAPDKGDLPHGKSHMQNRFHHLCCCWRGMFNGERAWTAGMSGG